MRKPAASAENSAPLLRLPAEWEPHAATWLAWPHFRGDWPGKFESIPWVYAEIIRYLSRRERVELIVKDSAAEKIARKILKRAHALNDNIRFHRWRTNRVWTRDSGCAFVWPIELSTRAGTPVPPSSAKGSAPLRGDGGTGVLARAPQLVAIKWRFNAWAKYPNWKHDEKIGSRMAKATGTPAFQPTFGKTRVVLG